MSSKQLSSSFNKQQIFADQDVTKILVGPRRPQDLNIEDFGCSTNSDRQPPLIRAHVAISREQLKSSFVTVDFQCHGSSDRISFTNRGDEHDPLGGSQGFSAIDKQADGLE